MTADFIRRMAEKLGAHREFYVEKNMPTVTSNILVIPFYGDLRSTFIFSTFILRPYKDLHRDKYVILCSWKGFQGLFPYVDEYWHLGENDNKLALEANNFYNNATLYTGICKTVAEFTDFFNTQEFTKLYDNGFTKKYREDFGGEIRKYLPAVPSSSVLSQNFLHEAASKEGRKVVVYPVTRVRSWQKGKEAYLPLPIDFWSALFDSLLENNYVPVIYQNCFTYDMSRQFADKCIYIVPKNVSDLLAAMRHVGLVLDVYSGISRMALVARTPFLAVDERMRFVEQHDYEIDDMFKVPRRYIYSFSSMLLTGDKNDWKNSVLDCVISKLSQLEEITSDNLDWGDPQESYNNISFDKLKERKAKRLGLKFIKSQYRS